MSAMARIIILNGAGSAGKSSIAKALQAIATEPFLHVAMDTFLEMLPERYWNHPDTFSYRIGSEDGKPSVAVETGPLGLRLMRGMRRAIAELARQQPDCRRSHAGRGSRRLRPTLVGVRSLCRRRICTARRTRGTRETTRRSNGWPRTVAM
jgi:chloramphenicol 3-O-phosphotransferase